MVGVLGVGLCRILASASLVDDSQSRIDARAVPRKNLSSNGCRKDYIRNLADASEGRLMALGLGGKAFASDHNEASGGGEPCQGG